MASELDRAYELLALAKTQRDPVGIRHWQDEILRLTNAAAYQRMKAARAAELQREGR